MKFNVPHKKQSRRDRKKNKNPNNINFLTLQTDSSEYIDLSAGSSTDNTNERREMMYVFITNVKQQTNQSWSVRM